MPATPAPTAAVDAPAEATVKVSVPQHDGTIVINTFDTKTPHRFNVNGGVIETDKAGADLLIARLDGASISS